MVCVSALPPEGLKGPCPRSSIASVAYVLSSDHEVLGVPGFLRSGESSGALYALGLVHAEDRRAGPDWKESRSGWMGFLCPFSSWHKTLFDSSELMLRSTHL